MNVREKMNKYKERFGLENAHFTLIEHDDAMVATVFKVDLENNQHLILKICSKEDDYLRELYFLNYFQGKVPVPKVIKSDSPAILMEYLPGTILKKETLTSNLCHEIGTLLARIHLEGSPGYGDLTAPQSLSSDPRIPFRLKFEEEFEECRDHLPSTLLTNLRKYYDRHIDLLLNTDGPCIIHRDFRPGNIIANLGKVEGIIDWSAARGSFAEQDFYSLDDWSNKEAFLSGYASVRKVPDYERVMPLLKLAKAMGVIGFTVKRGTWENKDSKIYRLSRNYLESKSFFC